MKRYALFSFPLALLAALPTPAATAAEAWWHGRERVLHYTPDGGDFVCIGGTGRFNRALYGSGTPFRIETGDRPEFGFYMPQMGGNLALGLIYRDASGKEASLWLPDMAWCEMRYRPGMVIYTLRDARLGEGELRLTAIPMSGCEGALFYAEQSNLPPGTELFIRFGGASNKRFSRNGDLGVDPADCFDLRPESCAGNRFLPTDEGFDLYYGADSILLRQAATPGYRPDPADKRRPRKLRAILPPQAATRLASPLALTTPLDMWRSSAPADAPLAASRMPLGSEPLYLCIAEGFFSPGLTYADLPEQLRQADIRRTDLARSIRFKTPDPFINPVGGALAIAADAIWEAPAWQHGAIGWRMPLAGWRAAYTGDAVGRHDRARTHFDAYAASQVTNVPPTSGHPAQDSALNLCRAEKRWGTPMYSNGYIARYPGRADVMNHYDMNLVYVDELLRHLDHTGDLDYARKVWPLLTLHLAWEKRNFDPDDDGLYDAYCCIWASDALEYNSGAVTHSSAYNYYANKRAAQIARLIGKDPEPYAREAAKILQALNERLWMKQAGHWAEYQDFMGLRRLHPAAALWTIYHAIDSETATPFQAWEATRYVDTNLPHIPVRGRGLTDEGYATVATTNWMPYQWSINNVAFAEVAHMALAYWQAGRAEEAFMLLKSSFIDGMYLGASPGNFGQISFYDAACGESYRDFGDPIGITSRALMEGLYGVRPDRLNGRILLAPGFPAAWPKASLRTPDISYSFERVGQTDTYHIALPDSAPAALTLRLRAPRADVGSVVVNGRPSAWRRVADAVGTPQISIDVPRTASAEVTVCWSGDTIVPAPITLSARCGEHIALPLSFKATELKDPQGVLRGASTARGSLTGTIVGEPGLRTLYLRTSKGRMTWWEPVSIAVADTAAMPASGYVLAGIESRADLEPTLRPVDLTPWLNSRVSDIFTNRYLAPRSPYTTLQIPVQGIGEWCHPTQSAAIADADALRADSIFTTPFGLPFRIAPKGENDVLYTSLWDNYPTSATIPLSGRASHAYLLMAGSTNPMQSRIENAGVTVTYTDGSTDRLPLVNPTTWAPIERDYYYDDYAFRVDHPRPYRVALADGTVSRTLGDALGLTSGENTAKSGGADVGLTRNRDRIIPGGAAIVLDLPLNPHKQLASLTLETSSNDVVVGLMALTLGSNESDRP